MFALTILVSCAPNGGLAVDELEQQLQVLTLPDHPGLVTAVKCPTPLAPAAGDVVVCEATIGTQQAPLEVTFGEERGQVTQAIVAARLVSTADIEQTAATTLTADLGQATQFRCPQPVMVVEPGASIRCTATDATGKQRTLLATPTDTGTVRLSFE